MFNYTHKTNFQYLSIIDKLGYIPRYSQYDKVLYDSIHKSLKTLGKSYAKALLFNMCSLYGLSENELLTNYDLFEKSIYRILGNTANLIIDIIKKDMLRHVVLLDPDITVSDILNPTLTVDTILKRIHEAEVFNFVRKIQGGEHVIFLYENQNSFTRILSAFFDPDVSATTPKGVLTILPYWDPKNNNNLTYNELLTSQNDKAMKKFEHWISTLHSSNKSLYNQPTRIAEEDATWWLRNGFTEEFTLFEQSLKRHDNISFLCAFKISNLTHSDINTLKAIIASHRHIILEDPFMIFRAQEVNQKR